MEIFQLIINFLPKMPKMAKLISLPSLVRLGCQQHCKIGKGWSVTDRQTDRQTDRHVTRHHEVQRSGGPKKRNEISCVHSLRSSASRNNVTCIGKSKQCDLYRPVESSFHSYVVLPISNRNIRFIITKKKLRVIQIAILPLKSNQIYLR